MTEPAYTESIRQAIESDPRIDQMQTALRSLANLTVKNHDATERVLDHVVRIAKRDAIRDTMLQHQPYHWGGNPLAPRTPDAATPAGAQQRITDLNAELSRAHRATRAVEAERDALRRQLDGAKARASTLSDNAVQAMAERNEARAHQAQAERDRDDARLHRTEDQVRLTNHLQALLTRAFAQRDDARIQAERLRGEVAKLHAELPGYGLHDGQDQVAARGQEQGR